MAFGELTDDVDHFARVTRAAIPLVLVPAQCWHTHSVCHAVSVDGGLRRERRRLRRRGGRVRLGCVLIGFQKAEPEPLTIVGYGFHRRVDELVPFVQAGVVRLRRMTDERLPRSGNGQLPLMDSREHVRDLDVALFAPFGIKDLDAAGAGVRIEHFHVRFMF